MNARCKTGVVQHPAYALLLRLSVARSSPPSQTAHHLLQADQRMTREGILGWMVVVGFFVKYLWSQLQRHIRTKPLRTVCLCVCMCGCKSANAGEGEGGGFHPPKHTQPRSNRSVPPSSVCEKKAEEQRGLMEDERRSRVFNGNVYSIIRSPVAVRQSNISDKKYMHNNTAALCCCCCCC